MSLRCCARPRAAREPSRLIERLTPMALIQELDFIGIPSQDPDRARSFYR